MARSYLPAGYRRRNPSLPAIRPDAGRPFGPDLTRYWTRRTVRAADQSLSRA